MQVKTWITLEQEVEVDVRIGDVMATITNLEHDDQVPMACDCINAAHGVFAGIPDEVIAKMTPAQREIISGALTRQAARFAA